MSWTKPVLPHLKSLNNCGTCLSGLQFGGLNEMIPRGTLIPAPGIWWMFWKLLLDAMSSPASLGRPAPGWVSAKAWLHFWFWSWGRQMKTHRENWVLGPTAPEGKYLSLLGASALGFWRLDTTGLAWPAALAKPTGISFSPGRPHQLLAASQRRGWVWGMLGTRKLAGNIETSVRKQEGAGGRGRWVSPFVSEGFPGGASGKEPTCWCRRCKRCRFHPWVGKIPWRRAWQPTPVFLPGESHGQRSLAGYSPWGRTVIHYWSDIVCMLCFRFSEG